VLRHGEAWILREDGNPLHRLARPGRRQGCRQGSGAGASKREAEQILDFSTCPKSTATPTMPKRFSTAKARSRSAGSSESPPVRAETAPNPPLLLARNRHRHWISGSRGAFRFDSDGHLLRAFGVRLGLRLAAAAQWLLVGHGITLALLSTVDSTRDPPSCVCRQRCCALDERPARGMDNRAGVAWPTQTAMLHALDNSDTLIDLSIA